MQGQIIRLQGEFTDDNLPRYYPEDQRLSKGSILLLEPGHPANPVAGLSTLLSLPNIAQVPSSIVTGSLAAAQAGRVYIGSAATTSSKAFYERTTKGGIHGIVSQDKTKFTSTDNHGASVDFDFSSHVILAYMKANPTHQFYVSFWGRITRAGGAKDGVGAYPSVGATICGYSGGVDYFLIQQTGSNLPVSDILPGRISRMRPDPTNALASNGVALGPIRRSTGVSSVSGTVASVLLAKAATWARRENGLNALAPAYTAYPSYVFYSLHVEDCTVSGRSLAEADAVDQVEFIKHLETVGGRYYGDTFTDPATLA